MIFSTGCSLTTFGFLLFLTLLVAGLVVAGASSSATLLFLAFLGFSAGISASASFSSPSKKSAARLRGTFAGDLATLILSSAAAGFGVFEGFLTAAGSSDFLSFLGLGDESAAPIRSN